jgi:RimJ/RimL family protein N-acetyltransferase
MECSRCARLPKLTLRGFILRRHRLRLGRVILNTIGGSGRYLSPISFFLLETGTTLVALDTSTGGTHEAKIIGCSRYYPAPDIKESMSIGFTFLDHLYWGGAWNRAMKALMLAHAFETFDEVWLHIAPTNIRSQKAAQKIGATYAYTADLAVTGAATETLCYRISKIAWQQLSLNSSQQG